jgi:ABC-type branched-subunit amino acid transport system substrate-binding protein
MVSLKGKLIFLFLLVASASPLHALSQSMQQDSLIYRADVERTFQDALSLFRARQFEEADGLFTRITEQAPESHRVTAAYIMSAKSCYRLGEYDKSMSMLKTLRDRYPTSEYVDDAGYTNGLDLYQLRQFLPAAREFLAVRQTSPDTLLQAHAEQMLGVVALAHLRIEELRQLLQEASIPPTRSLLAVRLAEKVLNAGNVSGAENLLRPITALPPTTPFVAEAAALLDRIEKSGILRVGVVLPLMQSSGESTPGGAGEEMLNGIRLAVDEYNAEALPKVNLDVRDSEHDAGVAARQVSELTMDDGILAIVGPVFSNEAFAAANLANARGVPLITPTATFDGIAATGDYAFQANPDFSMRGRAMAQYAYAEKNARRFAVLSATDTVSKLLTNAFIDEVGKLGGQLVDAEWYDPGSTDLRSQLTEMRRRAMALTEHMVVNFAARLRPSDLTKILKLGVPRILVDSLNANGASMDVDSLLGPGGQRIADSLRIPTERTKALYDSLEIPVTTVDAVFLPISDQGEIGIVTSQLRLLNFQTQLLGTGNWYDLNELDQNRSYANGVVFSTDAYWEEVDQRYQQFEEKFRAMFSKAPTSNAMFGYDTMQLLLRVIRRGATRREDIASALSTVRNFQGVHSKISLIDSRVNSWLTLLQFKNRTIQKVGEIDVARNNFLSSQ